MSEETTNQQSCGGKKRAMLAYGLVQISATVVSAVSLAAISVGLCAVKQESRLFNGCVETVVAEGRSQAEAVRYCNGGLFRQNFSSDLASQSFQVVAIALQSAALIAPCNAHFELYISSSARVKSSP